MNDGDILSISGLLKARPAEEAGQRVLYMEASNEHVDLQGERVLAKSLQDAAGHFLKFGNLDLDHRTLLPPRAGENPYLWEIGQPVDVRADNDRTMVKAVLYQGDGRAAENANMVWESMTRLSPPARWYPSVGGQVLARAKAKDPLTKAETPIITKVRWTNIGLSRTPVNSALPPISTIPAEVFAKCCLGDGCIDLSKALEAGYGTDSATLTDGAALRTQSLDKQPQAVLPITDDEVREVLARYLRRGGAPDQPALCAHLQKTLSLPPDDATARVGQFLRDLRAHTHRSNP